LRFRRFRLRLRKNIERVLKNGILLKHKDFPYFSIKVLENESINIGYPRFTVIVPKKSVKKAVRRNRIKRIVREAMRELIAESKIPNLDIVILVREDISSKKSYEVRDEIEKIFQKYQGILTSKRG
jgi:ribonuclease P protein component